jgi:anti-sigma regulatory factor (Ser/Thr protein kinase)
VSIRTPVYHAARRHRNGHGGHAGGGRRGRAALGADAPDNTLDGLGWPAEATAGALVAVTEAMANALEHGSEPGGRIEIAYSAGPGGAHVLVADEGRPGTRIPRAPRRDPRAAACAGGDAC